MYWEWEERLLTVLLCSDRDWRCCSSFSTNWFTSHPNPIQGVWVKFAEGKRFNGGNWSSILLLSKSIVPVNFVSRDCFSRMCRFLPIQLNSCGCNSSRSQFLGLSRDTLLCFNLDRNRERSRTSPGECLYFDRVYLQRFQIADSCHLVVVHYLSFPRWQRYNWCCGVINLVPCNLTRRFLGLIPLYQNSSWGERTCLNVSRCTSLLFNVENMLLVPIW